MKKILFIVLASFHLAYSQECPKVIEISGYGEICINEILVTERAQNLRSSDLRLKTFYDYFLNTSYSEFQTLFLPNEGFEISNQKFDEWRSLMRNNPLSIEGMYEYERKGVRYCDILYSLVHDNFVDRSSLTIKKAGNKWYVISNSENNLLTPVNSLFRLYKVEYLNNMTNARSLNKINIQSVMDEYKNAKFYSSKNSTFFNLQERTDASIILAEDRKNDNKFVAYMDSINIPKSEQQVVLQEIRELKYDYASKLLSEIRGSDLWVPIHNTKIREIYGPGRIFIYNPKTGKFE